eukprot:26565-Amphidinium_carterae.1
MHTEDPCITPLLRLRIEMDYISGDIPLFTLSPHPTFSSVRFTILTTTRRSFKTSQSCEFALSSVILLSPGKSPYRRISPSPSFEYVPSGDQPAREDRSFVRTLVDSVEQNSKVDSDRDDVFTVTQVKNYLHTAWNLNPPSCNPDATQVRSECDDEEDG